ncbi:class I adenylate-forming enzyme family protein [Janibacter limosus]|jgi:fatty-acyl-CoA synthase/feruloyl-CoA synthase|uniref:Long-chain-fatty-acid--CoA ligase n=1 Tax=Janibacter limosus TaxID=53458 RepID=A0A4P6MZV1_9MICO|nr:long-chain fatty acid--CoA ligase [Janibacter limosus]QBF47590.1 long-chain-fatty-acid--CoA ligase [Janibacter limosus]
MATLAGQLARSAASYPTKTALVFEGRELTYRQLDEEVNRHAHALTALGVTKGDRVALMSGNSDGFVIAMYAVFRLGAIVVPVNPRATSPELRHLLTDSGASVLLLGAGMTPAVEGLVELDPIERAPHVLALDVLEGYPSLRVQTASQPSTAPDVVVEESDDCIIIYTSGTTGLAKGALFDHHRMLWVGHSMASLGTTGMDRHLHVAPLYHCAQLVLFMLNSISVGATNVVLPAFEPQAVADALEEHRITVFLGVPTMYQLMLRLPDLAERDFSAWRLGFFGAAPMPPQAVEQLTATLPAVDFFQLCGQTEGGPTGIYLTPDEVRARPDATGRWPIPNCEVRVVDADGQDVAAGAAGEIIYRGETLMKEYWGQPEATADTIRDGWLHSGDIARVDADGFMTIVDRMKDMIITGGRNVYSVEVENALAGHPDVADVAVIGHPDETFGERIVAVVTPHEGGGVTLDGLREFASAHVADYKLPRELIVREIPRNPSGKILKHVLRDETVSR